MKAFNGIKTENYHFVLQKFINLILFETTINPKFTKQKTELVLHKNLLDFLSELNTKTLDKTNEITTIYTKEKLVVYFKRLRNKDLKNLMDCYGYSYYRLCYNFSCIRATVGKEEKFIPHEKDEEIAIEMLYKRKFPKEIKDYLYLQFYDLLSIINNESNFITEKQYQDIINRYVGEYESIKVESILNKNKKVFELII